MLIGIFAFIKKRRIHTASTVVKGFAKTANTVILITVYVKKLNALNECPNIFAPIELTISLPEAPKV